MKNGLYRVEVDMSFPNLNEPGGPQNPGTDDCYMITNKRGIFFAKLHPVKITAEPKKKKSAGCFYCDNKRVDVVIPIDTEPPFLAPHLHALPVQKARYCFYCGRHLEKEAQE